MSQRRVLFDENLPVRLRQWLPDVKAATVEFRGWKGARSGEFVRSAQPEFFANLEQQLGQGSRSFICLTRGGFKPGLKQREAAFMHLASLLSNKAPQSKIAKCMDNAAEGVAFRSSIRVDLGPCYNVVYGSVTDTRQDKDRFLPHGLPCFMRDAHKRAIHGVGDELWCSGWTIRIRIAVVSKASQAGHQRRAGL